MILNEDYFKDLEIEDEDIVSDDDTLDVEKPKMTIEDFCKLPEQYDYLIKIMIRKKNDKETTSFLTSLLPKLFKRLDVIFDSYGIEHSQYVLRSTYYTGKNNTILDFGNYQLFCDDCIEDIYINDTYQDFLICVYANYPKFSYKRAFRFVYTMLNIFKIDEHFHSIRFEPTKQHTKDMEIGIFYYPFSYILRLYDINREIILYDSSNEIKPERKRMFYDYVIRHFFGKDAQADYKAIDRDVPLKPFLNYN